MMKLNKKATAATAAANKSGRGSVTKNIKLKPSLNAKILKSVSKVDEKSGSSKRTLPVSPITPGKQQAGNPEVYKKWHNIGRRKAAEFIGTYKESEIAIFFKGHYWPEAKINFRQKTARSHQLVSKTKSKKVASSSQNKDALKESVVDLKTAPDSESQQRPQTRSSPRKTNEPSAYTPPKDVQQKRQKSSVPESTESTTSKSCSPNFEERQVIGQKQEKPANDQIQEKMKQGKQVTHKNQEMKVTAKKQEKQVTALAGQKHEKITSQKRGKLVTNQKQEKQVASPIQDKQVVSEKSAKGAAKKKQEKPTTNLNKSQSNKKLPKVKESVPCKKSFDWKDKYYTRIKRTASLNAGAIVSLMFEKDEPLPKKLKMELDDDESDASTTTNCSAIEALLNIEKMEKQNIKKPEYELSTTVCEARDKIGTKMINNVVEPRKTNKKKTATMTGSKCNSNLTKKVSSKKPANSAKPDENLRDSNIESVKTESKSNGTINLISPVTKNFIADSRNEEKAKDLQNTGTILKIESVSTRSPAKTTWSNNGRSNNDLELTGSSAKKLKFEALNANPESKPVIKSSPTKGSDKSPKKKLKTKDSKDKKPKVKKVELDTDLIVSAPVKRMASLNAQAFLALCKEDRVKRPNKDKGRSSEGKAGELGPLIESNITADKTSRQSNQPSEQPEKTSEQSNRTFDQPNTMLTDRVISTPRKSNHMSDVPSKEFTPELSSVSSSIHDARAVLGWSPSANGAGSTDGRIQFAGTFMQMISPTTSDAQVVELIQSQPLPPDKTFQQSEYQQQNSQFATEWQNNSSTSSTVFTDSSRMIAPCAVGNRSASDQNLHPEKPLNMVTTLLPHIPSVPPAPICFTTPIIQQNSGDQNGVYYPVSQHRYFHNRYAYPTHNMFAYPDGKGYITNASFPAQQLQAASMNPYNAKMYDFVVPPAMFGQQQQISFQFCQPQISTSFNQQPFYRPYLNPQQRVHTFQNPQNIALPQNPSICMSYSQQPQVTSTIQPPANDQLTAYSNNRNFFKGDQETLKSSPPSLTDISYSMPKRLSHRNKTVETNRNKTVETKHTSTQVKSQELNTVSNPCTSNRSMKITPKKASLRVAKDQQKPRIIQFAGDVEKSTTLIVPSFVSSSNHLHPSEIRKVDPASLQYVPTQVTQLVPPLDLSSNQSKNIPEARTVNKEVAGDSRKNVLDSPSKVQRNLSNSLTKKSKVQGRSELAASSSIRIPQPIVNIPYRLDQSLSPLVPNMNCRFIITNGNSVQAMNSVGEKQVTSEQIPSELKCKVSKSATKQIEARSKVDQCPELKGNKDKNARNKQFNVETTNGEKNVNASIGVNIVGSVSSNPMLFSESGAPSNSVGVMSCFDQMKILAMPNPVKSLGFSDQAIKSAKRKSNSSKLNSLTLKRPLVLLEKLMPGKKLMLSATMGQHEPLLAMNEIRLPLPDDANAEILVDTSSKVSNPVNFVASSNVVMFVDDSAKKVDPEGEDRKTKTECLASKSIAPKQQRKSLLSLKFLKVKLDNPDVKCNRKKVSPPRTHSMKADCKLIKSITSPTPVKACSPKYKKNCSIMDVRSPDKKYEKQTRPPSEETGKKMTSTLRKDIGKACSWKLEGEPKMQLVHNQNDGSAVNRLCYQAIHHDDGDVIRVRDCVLVRSGMRKRDLPYIAKIYAFWESQEMNELMMGVFWYYRREHKESEQLVPKYIDNEVFASRHRDVIPVACIEDRCHVLTLNEFCRYKAHLRRVECGGENLTSTIVPTLNETTLNKSGSPSLDADQDTVFLCRHIYDVKLRRILKNPQIHSPAV